MKKQKKEKSDQKTNETIRFVLLPIASLLYGYGIASFSVAAAILVIFAIRKDLSVFSDISFEIYLIVVLGMFTFFPAQKFRKNLFNKL